MKNLNSFSSISVNLDELRLISPPPCDRSVWWKPIKHSDLVESLVYEFGSRDWHLQDRSFFLSNNSHHLVALFQFETLRGKNPLTRGLPTFCVETATNVRSAMHCYYGCSLTTGGLFLGEKILSKRHTTSTDLNKLSSEMATQFFRKIDRVTYNVSKLASRPINEAWASRFSMLMAEAGAIPSGKAIKIWEEFKKTQPAGDRNQWTFMECCCRVIQRYSSHLTLFKRLTKAREFLFHYERS